MKNISIDMMKNSPVCMKFIKAGPEDTRQMDFDEHINPILTIICKHFIDEQMQMRRCKPYSYRILEKDLLYLK
jgi:hypothetical protein